MTDPRQTFIMPAVGRDEFITRFTRQLAALPERRYALSVEPYRKLRSTEQNRLMWALYEDILALGGEQLAGWTKTDLHEWCLGEYGGWDTLEGLGRRRIRPALRSSRMNKQEFTDYVEWICTRMAEFGIVLTLPGDVI